MARVLKPGGRLLVLEFSHVWKPLQKPYDLYSFNVLPWLGEKVAGDAAAYRYLAESIRMHPDQRDARRHAGTRRTGAGRIFQPHRRRGRRASRLQTGVSMTFR